MRPFSVLVGVGVLSGALAGCLVDERPVLPRLTDVCAGRGFIGGDGNLTVPVSATVLNDAGHADLMICINGHIAHEIRMAPSDVAPHVTGTPVVDVPAGRLVVEVEEYHQGLRAREVFETADESHLMIHLAEDSLHLRHSDQPFPLD